MRQYSFVATVSFVSALPEPSSWTIVASSDHVAPGQIIDHTHGETDVVIWRTASGEPCAMSARCPHLWSHLGAEGVVDDNELVCCTHGWRFDTAGTATVLRNGRRDRMADIEVYPVTEHNGQILAQLPDEADERSTD